jgi:hypothetical protein
MSIEVRIKTGRDILTFYYQRYALITRAYSFAPFKSGCPIDARTHLDMLVRSGF